MDFSFTDEQRQLQREVRGWLAANYPLDRDWDGPQDDRWQELAELGWLGVSVAEDEGGAGLGFVEEAILLEELGYALYPGPYLATVGFALTALGPEGSVAKLRWSEQNQRLTKLGRELLGREGLLDDGWWHYQQLRSRGNTIEAGTSEILRNIIAERVLGLPRSR